jgi:membrane-bound serine protease (ClpP class)
MKNVSRLLLFFLAGLWLSLSVFADAISEPLLEDVEEETAVTPEDGPIVEEGETEAPYPVEAPAEVEDSEDGPSRHRVWREWPEDAKVMLIPVRQAIMKPQQILLRRGVQRAIAEDVDAIVLLMDTPGGSVGVMREMVSLVIDLDIPTFTLVEADAFSAGAILALATDYVFMKPMTVIGNAMPIMMSPGGGVTELGEAEREKVEGGMDVIVRSIAQAKGRDEKLMQAMVRRNMEFVLEDGTVISEKGQILTLTNQEAAQILPNGEPLLSEGTVLDLDEMLRLVGLENAERIEEIPTWADELAGWITQLAPIFITLALVLGYMEIQSPGIGWMGALALTFFLLVMFGHNVAGFAGKEDMLLIALGVILILVEVFVIPGFGVVGLSGIVLMIWGFLRAMTIRNPGNPTEFGLDAISNLGPAITNLSSSVIVSIVIMGFMLRSIDKSKFVREKLILQDEISGRAVQNPLAGLLGKIGVTLSPLNPGGSIEIDGREYSGISDAGFVEAGQSVQVRDVHGNRVVVSTEFSASEPTQETPA